MIRTFEDSDIAPSGEKSSGYVQSAVDNAKEVATDVSDRAATVVREAMDNPQQFARESVGSVTRYTKERPLEALALAAGLAFVVGALWKR